MVILVIKPNAAFSDQGYVIFMHLCSIFTISCRSSIEELLDVYHKQVNIALRNEVREL